MRELAYQFCVVDPEGDYSEFPDAVVIGDAKQEPRIAEVMGLLAKPDVNVVVNLLAIDPPERPRFLVRFLPEMAKLRAETGRPHWIVLDEAHHCLPAKWDPAPVDAAAGAAGSHRRDRSSGGGLAGLSGAGVDGRRRRRRCPRCHRQILPGDRTNGSADHRAALGAGQVPAVAQAAISRSSHGAGRRKARNVTSASMPRASWARTKLLFSRPGEGAQSAGAEPQRPFCSWPPAWTTGHGCIICASGEYSRWFRNAIKDEDLAAEAAAVESDADLVAQGQSGMHQANDRTAIHSAGATVAGWRTFLGSSAARRKRTTGYLRPLLFIERCGTGCVLSKSVAVRSEHHGPERDVSKVCPRYRVRLGILVRVLRGPGRRRRVGDYGSDVRLFRYLATCHQHRDDDRNVPDGFPDPGHAEPRLRKRSTSNWTNLYELLARRALASSASRTCPRTSSKSCRVSSRRFKPNTRLARKLSWNRAPSRTAAARLKSHRSKPTKT